MEIDCLFSFRQDASLSATYIDRQFNDVYVGKADFQVQHLALEANAVCAVKLVTLSAFQAMVLGEKEGLAPVYARECQDVLFFLRKRPSPQTTTFTIRCGTMVSLSGLLLFPLGLEHMKVEKQTSV